MNYAATPDQGDEQILRGMADQALSRLNKGDLTVFDDFWAEDADYVSVGGKLIGGREPIKEFFRELIKSSDGQAQQSSSTERIRFLTPELAVIEGFWTVTGARDAAGKGLPPIKGRGLEVAQKRDGRWWFVATREMVIFKGG
jgi:uncharacterized protein (TIGR02246 family)